MAERHSSQLSNQERVAFGNWLSGFVDGEGCFMLDLRQRQASRGRGYPGARFEITLRQDDLPVLRLIHAFWGIGSVHRLKNRPQYPEQSPSAEYCVSGVIDHMAVLVPHFHRYPLRAKKQRDFEIWEQGVLLLNRVYWRKFTCQPSSNGPRKWTDADLTEFADLRLRLQAIRKFVPPQ